MTLGIIEVVPETGALILTIDNFSMNEPEPIDPYIKEHYIGYNYDNHVAIRTEHMDDGSIKATIQTVPGTGRGQLDVFEDIVGIDIASQRPTASQKYSQVNIKASNRRYIRNKVAKHVREAGDPTFFVPKTERFMRDYEDVYQGVQVDVD